jgi:hypothetical protein
VVTPSIAGQMNRDVAACSDHHAALREDMLRVRHVSVAKTLQIVPRLIDCLILSDMVVDPVKRMVRK